MSILSSLVFRYEYKGQGTYSPHHDLYYCSFSANGVTERFPFQKITGVYGKPERDEVLSRIICDAEDYMDADGIDDFARKYHAMDKKFVAMRAYYACKSEYEQLVHLLGSEEAIRKVRRELGARGDLR